MSYTPQNLNIKSWAVKDRPREKLLQKGRKHLSDAELMAILIGSGTRSDSAVSLSKKILASMDNDLDLLAKMDVDDLIKFKGIGEAKAISIVAALELGRRRQFETKERTLTIKSSQDAYKQMAAEFLDLGKEEFWILLLNRANRVIDKKLISKGGVSGTVVDPKIIYKSALSKLASSIILFHNHPSGNLKPSKADLDITKKLSEAGKTLDIRVLDHLIIHGSSYFSFADEGML